MINPESLLELAESLIHNQTNTYCSDLHRKILLSTLRGERKTYEQFADECGYSCKYIKHDIAPKLWHLLSTAIGEKVTKSNVRPILETQMRSHHHLDRSNFNWQVSPVREHRENLQEIPSTMNNSSQFLSSPAAKLTRANILLVDDEPKNLKLLSDLLEEQGYQVRQAINGAIALEAINLAAPDLILLDICMPELDGYSVCQKLKANPQTKDIPVIFVTAFDEPWNKVKAFSVGAVDYIHKPFKVIEVLARIENQLKIKQLQQELLARNAQLQQALQELQRLAAIDSVTGVSSRDRFNEYLVFNWHQASKTQTPLTLIFAEIDRLDRDENNHMKAQLLFETAQTIKNIFQRPQDLIARYEDTTFGIILPDLEIEKGAAMARTLLDRIKKIEISGNESNFNLRIAIAAVLPDRNFQLESFLTKCSSLLDRAKQEDGDRIILAE